MESRRSFLAAALAWLASLVALAWPRRGLSAPRRGFTPPTAPAEPDVRRYASAYREPASNEEVRVYQDLTQLLDEMHAHLCVTGHSVLSADDPEARRVGFFTFGREGELKVTWQVPLTRVIRGSKDVPASFAGPDRADARDIFLECLKSGEGRIRLARAYESGARERFKAGLGPLPR